MNGIDVSTISERVQDLRKQVEELKEAVWSGGATAEMFAKAAELDFQATRMMAELDLQEAAQ